MADMKLRHLVETGVTPANLQVRLNANADLGWMFLQAVLDGAGALTVIWQKRAFE
jgi:hypothetical protein